MPSPCVRAVLDTNDFLEHRRFTEVPWLEVLDATKVILVVPWKVVTELDSAKSNNRSATKRERARSLLPLIEQFSQTAAATEVRSGVTMEYFHGNVEEVCRSNDLTASQADHVIIACALLVRDQSKDCRTLLVTGDTGMRMTSRRVGMPVVPMPDEYRLPHALDDEERERREAERELLRIQARRPRIRIGWGENCVPYIRLALSPKIPRTTDEIETAVKTHVGKLRKPYLPSSLGGPDIEAMLARDLDRFAAFEKEYRSYLLALTEAEVTASLSVELSPSLVNSGSMPASDCRLKLIFPEAIKVVDSLPRIPKPPEPPSRSLFDNMFGGYGGLHDFSGLRAPQTRKNVASWVEGNCIVMRVDKLRHSMTARGDTFYACFADHKSIAPFEVQFQLVADELLEPEAGVLKVVAETVGATSGDN